MTFNTLPFSERVKVLGDEAEYAFTEWADIKNIQYESYGFIRPKITQWWNVPIFIRKTPDFIAHAKSYFLVEVKGCGAASHVKIKENDLPVLGEWNQKLPLWFFIYDSHNKCISFTHYTDTYAACMSSQKSEFNDGNAFYKVPKRKFLWEDFSPKEIIHGY